jgi:hypothetical protein
MCPRFSVFVLSCVGSGLASGWSPLQGVLPIDSYVSENNFWNGTGQEA